MYFAEADQVLWVYENVVQHRTNFIPTGKTYSVVVMLYDGRIFDIPMSRKTASQEALQYIAANMPYLFIGYDEDWVEPVSYTHLWLLTRCCACGFAWLLAWRLARCRAWTWRLAWCRAWARRLTRCRAWARCLARCRTCLLYTSNP